MAVLPKLLVGAAMRTPKFEKMERHLFFGPHPDDIEIGCGALVGRLSREGKKIRFVIVTDGRHGSATIPSADLVAIRKAEAIRSAKILGVDDVVFLGFPDGELKDDDEIFRAMAAEAASFAPDVIYAPNARVANEFHPDHVSVGKAAERLLFSSPHKGVMASLGLSPIPLKAAAFYMTSDHNRKVRVKASDFRSQLEAIRAHESQLGSLAQVFSYLKIRSFSYGIGKLALHGEAYLVRTPSDCHCLPEKA